MGGQDRSLLLRAGTTLPVSPRAPQAAGLQLPSALTDQDYGSHEPPRRPLSPRCLGQHGCGAACGEWARPPSSAIVRHPRAPRPRGARGRRGGVRGTPVRRRDLPQGCGEGSRGARRGVIVAPLPAMVDGGGKAGGCGSLTAAMRPRREPRLARAMLSVLWAAGAAQPGGCCVPAPRGGGSAGRDPAHGRGRGAACTRRVSVLLGEEPDSHGGRSRSVIWDGPALFSCSGS